MKPWVCLGVIAAAHGIKGHVKIKAFTEDPESITKYGKLVDDNQKTVSVLQFLKNSPTTGIATISGVTTRNAAELLKGTKLYVHQNQLPTLSETEIYHESLIGLPLVADGKTLGEVIGVYDFGAGCFCEIQTADKIGTIHLTSCDIFADHLKCDEANFLV